MADSTIDLANGDKLAAQSNVRSGVTIKREEDLSFIPNAVGYDILSQPLGEMPTVLTAVWTARVALVTLFVVNASGADRTVTITDGSGTPIRLVPPSWEFPWAGAQPYIGHFGGIEVLDGLKVQASGAGVNYAIVAYGADTP